MTRQNQPTGLWSRVRSLFTRYELKGRWISIRGSALELLFEIELKVRTLLRGCRGPVLGLVVVTVAGGTAGALIGADPRPPGENAEVRIAVNPLWLSLENRATRVNARLRYIERFARMPDVITAAATAAGFKPRHLAQHTKVELDEPTASLLVSARDDTVSSAKVLAVALANQAAAGAQRALRSSNRRTEVLGDFEAGAGTWNALPSSPPFPATNARPGTGSGRTGSGFLAVSCRPAPGCGVTSVVNRLFENRARQRITAWARARTGKPSVRLLAGVLAKDLVESQSVRLGPAWRPISVTWRPSQPFASTTLGVEVDGATKSRFDLDHITLVAPHPLERPDLPSQLSKKGDLRAVDRGKYVSIPPALATGTSGRLPVAAALVGAGAGLLIGLSSMVAGGVAARRRRAQ